MYNNAQVLKEKKVKVCELLFGVYRIKMKGNVLVNNLTFVICLLLELLGSVICSEFFADNGIGHQQTIVIDHHNKRKQAEVQAEILQLLGLHQRPHVVKHGFDYSAPKFMISLYNSLQTEDGEGITDEVEFHSKVNLTLGKAIEHINGTDVIRSFINHGKRLSLNKKYIRSLNSIKMTHN